FPLMDSLYLLLFIPGMIAALFGYYYIAGPMTLAVVPLTLLINGVMFRVQRRMFEERGLSVRRNLGGFLVYIFAFQLVMAPASIAGYLAELVGLRKGWGTK
ncbi:MAG: glycosyltransferase family 2 protein, partial [Nitrospiria bacterium]